jgi:uncharacterized membrane protein
VAGARTIVEPAGCENGGKDPARLSPWSAKTFSSDIKDGQTMEWQRHWHKHPAVRTGDQLTIGERYADHMRNGMGSWPFVFIFLAIMGVWAILNSVFYLGGSADGQHGFDPYPYILLNLMLSMIAGLQGAILLIAAKRSDQISSEVAVHTYENTTQLTELLSKVDGLTEQIHRHICLPAD